MLKASLAVAAIVTLSTSFTALGEWSYPNALICTFDEYAGGAFLEGVFDIKTGTKDFDLTLAAIDIQSGDAQLIGNNGAEQVFLFTSDYGLNFIERTLTGNMNMTTVFFTAQSTDGRYAAVHSRHNNVAVPIPSQAYGLCEPRW